MPAAALPAPIPVELLTIVARRHHPARRDHRTASRPGHLLHLMEKGEYTLVTNGRRYRMRPGDMIYYHDGEDVVWKAGEEDVEFLAIGFFAPSLDAPAMDERHFPSTPPLRRLFRRAVRIAAEPASVQRDFRLYAAVLDIVGRLPFAMARAGVMDPVAALWWEIESRLRRERRYRPALPELAREWGRSPATIARSCKRATGSPPKKRLDALCMEEARGLLLYGGLTVTETAERIGYPRMHEFSRAFKRHYGITPRALRGP